jgi:endonuclease/exonuclease/phosphatase family metal-dependent hydrolase
MRKENVTCKMDGSGIQIRTLTLNCLFHPGPRARLRVIGQLLEGSDLDVICLQEVVWRRNRRLLQGLLPSYPHAASKAYGLALMGGLLTLSRWPIESRRFEVYRRRGWWGGLPAGDRLLRKGFLATWVQAPWGPLLVVNTHLLANYDKDWSPQNRHAQHERDELNQLAAFLAAVDPDLPIVVAGDFNVPGSSRIFEDFLLQTGLMHASAGAPATHLVGAIDHVLVRPPAGRSASCQAAVHFADAVAGRRAVPISDHTAISVEIRIQPQPGQ